MLHTALTPYNKYTPNSHHSMIDYDLVLTHADSFDTHAIDETLAHDYDTNSPSICTHHADGLSYFIALARRVDMIDVDLNFLDYTDFDDINLSRLLCSLDEYCDYDYYLIVMMIIKSNGLLLQKI